MPIEIDYKNSWAASQGLTPARVERGEDVTLQLDERNALGIRWAIDGGELAQLTFLDRRLPRTLPRSRLDTVLDFLRGLRPSLVPMILIFEGRGFDLQFKERVIGTVRYMTADQPI